MFRSILLSLLSALCWIQDEMCMCGHTAATTRATGSPPSPQRYAPPSRLPPAGSTGPAGVVARGGDGRWAPQQSVALQPEGAASGGGQLAHRYVSRLWCHGLYFDSPLDWLNVALFDTVLTMCRSSPRAC
jgi:hypothetical protein